MTLRPPQADRRRTRRRRPARGQRQVRGANGTNPGPHRPAPRGGTATRPGPQTAESERDRDWQVADIAEVQALLPDAARFLATIQQISNPATTAWVLGRVAAGWARDGRVPQALQLAGQIHADQAQRVLPLAWELASAGRRQELLELIGRYPDGEFSLAICPALAQVDPGSLDGMAEALLQLSAAGS